MEKVISKVCTMVAAVLVCVLVACSAGTDKTKSTPAVTPEPVTIAGMDRAVRVGDLLFGGQPTKDALGELKAQGYKTVLTTRGEGELSWDEKTLVESLGMEFVSIPMSKPNHGITDDLVNRFAHAMAKGKRPMVLHCASGNRVAGLWGVWLVEHAGMDPQGALALAQKAGMTGIRPIVQTRMEKFANPPE